MKTRIVAGLFAAFLLVCLIAWGNYYAMMGVVMAAAVLAFFEFENLFFRAEGAPRGWLPLLLIELTLVGMSRNPAVAWILFWVSFLSLAVWHVVDGERENDFSKTIRHLSLEFFGYTYVLSLLGFLVPIGMMASRGRLYLLLIFLFVFVGDTVAYFVGKRWGKRKLAPHSSPKKTVAGSVGALLSSFVVAAVWLYCVEGSVLANPLGLKLLLLAPVISMLAQLGDLMESALKRSQAQKDSGSFLPGHGGILDRIDGLALAAPVFYFYLVFIMERS